MPSLGYLRDGAASEKSPRGDRHLAPRSFKARATRARKLSCLRVTISPKKGSQETHDSLPLSKDFPRNSPGFQPEVSASESVGRAWSGFAGKGVEPRERQRETLKGLVTCPT